MGATDVDWLDIEYRTVLLSGQQVLLFLKESDAPGITAGDDHYVIVSMDNGVFDILEGDNVVGPTGIVDDSIVIHPRGTGADMFGDATFKMSEIRKAIEPKSKEVGPTGSTN